VVNPAAKSRVSLSLTRLDGLLVRMRPTFFGYQFVAVLRPKNYDSVSHP